MHVICLAMLVMCCNMTVFYMLTSFERQKWVKWVLALAKQILAYRIRQRASCLFDAFTR